MPDCAAIPTGMAKHAQLVTRTAAQHLAARLDKNNSDTHGRRSSQLYQQRRTDQATDELFLVANRISFRWACACMSTASASSRNTPKCPLEEADSEFQTLLATTLSSSQSKSSLDEAVGLYTLKLATCTNPLMRSFYLCCLGDFAGLYHNNSSDESKAYYELAAKECKYYGLPFEKFAMKHFAAHKDTLNTLYYLLISQCVRVRSTFPLLRSAALSVLKHEATNSKARFIAALICDKRLVAEEFKGKVDGTTAICVALCVYHRLLSSRQHCLGSVENDLLDRIQVESPPSPELGHVLSLLLETAPRSISLVESRPFFELDVLPMKQGETPTRLHTMKLMAMQSLHSHVQALHLQSTTHRTLQTAKWHIIDVDVALRDWSTIKEMVEGGRVKIMIGMSLLRELDFRKKRESADRQAAAGIIRTIYDWSDRRPNVRLQSMTTSSAEVASDDALESAMPSLQKHHYDLVKFLLSSSELDEMVIVTVHPGLIAFCHARGIAVQPKVT